MKKNSLLAILILMIAFSSCKKDAANYDLNSISKSNNNRYSILKKYPDTIINILGSTSLNDLINRRKENSSELIDDSVWSSGNGHTLIMSSDENVVLDGYQRVIYPGSLLDGRSISNLTYKPLSQYQSHVKPITVSVSAHAKYVSGNIQAPSLSATRNFLASIYSDDFSGKELSSFSFDMNQFSYYSELKLAFNANVKVGSIFSIDGGVGKEKINKKTGLIAKFIQKNFTLDMDLPSDGELLDSSVNPTSLGTYSPVYVSSITYGRMGIFKVESESSYDSVRIAFNLAFKAGIVSGGASIEDAYKTIIDKASISVYTAGGEGSEIAQSINGYDAFRQYIISGGNYTAENPGYPLYFTLSYLSDNSVYSTIFNVDIPND